MDNTFEENFGDEDLRKLDQSDLITEHHSSNSVSVKLSEESSNKQTTSNEASDKPSNNKFEFPSIFFDMSKNTATIISKDSENIKSETLVINSLEILSSSTDNNSDIENAKSSNTNTKHISDSDSDLKNPPK